LGHHEAIVITLNEDGTPNPAPMGIDLVEASNDAELILIRPYRNSRTLKNILNNGKASIIITHDYRLFLKALYSREDMSYGRGVKLDVPIVIKGVDYVLECLVRNAEINDDVASVLLEVVNVIQGEGSVLSYSRANSSMIEALVYLTKVSALCADLPKRRGREYQLILKYSSKVLESLGTAYKLGNYDVRRDCIYLVNKLVDTLRNCYVRD